MTQDKSDPTAARTSRAEPNKDATFYGEPVLDMDMFARWHMTTMWPEQHDTAHLFLREMRQRAGEKGLFLSMFNVSITNGKASFKSTGLQGEPIDTRAWCYRVKFTPPHPENSLPMFGLYVVYDPQDVDQRTVGVIPVYDFSDPSLIVEDL